LNSKHILNLVDRDYIVGIRRQIHKYPELRFELPKTIKLVKDELDKMNIQYTEKYGKSSVVGVINPHLTNLTIGIRADMDALPIQEKNDVEYKSQIPGKMHACGHDGHTAALLGTAQVLSKIRDKINCRIKLIFQPSEEGFQSGAKLMVEDGIMDNIDVIIGAHVENTIDAGCIGVKKGVAMATSTALTVEFFGKTGHAAMPHTSIDALAMAVKTYNDIQMIISRELDPFELRVINVGSLTSGDTNNVVPDYAQMKLSIRTFSEEVEKYICSRIENIAKNRAEEVKGSCKVTLTKKLPSLYNDVNISNEIINSACKAVGEDKVVIFEKPKISSEDFSYYSNEKPGCFFRFGSRNVEKGFINMPHNNDWDFDEEALVVGAKVFIQYVLDKSAALEA
jgi:amidohydrolase